MKQLYLFTVTILFFTSTFGQIQSPDNTKFIFVTGSAEMNIAPDEIELVIELQEYSKEGYKFGMNLVDREFYKTLKKHHVDTSGMKFQGLYSYDTWYWWYWWQHRGDYYQKRTVTIKLDSSTNILKLVGDLNEKWVSSINISKSTHSKIYEYRRDVKKEAAKMAKEKATYLLESLGEELGGVLSVEEISADNRYYDWYASNTLSNSLMNANIRMQNDDSGISGANSLKLRYEVRVKFAIK